MEPVRALGMILANCHELPDVFQKAPTGIACRDMSSMSWQYAAHIGPQVQRGLFIALNGSKFCAACAIGRFDHLKTFSSLGN